jgi:hypothetical protein
MNQALQKALLSLAGLALKELSQNIELQDKVIVNVQALVDWLQEKSGRVNVHALEKAVQVAFDTAIKRDRDTMCQILALITSLYATHNVSRGAICGGTLLNFFGEDIFPHIDKRELRFAKEINQNVYDHVLSTIQADFDNKIESYQISGYADFTETTLINSSSVAVDGFLRPVMKQGYTFFNIIKTFGQK